MSRRIITLLLTACFVGALVGAGAQPAQGDDNGNGSGTLFVGTDQEEFTGTSLPVVGPDRLGRFQTSGPNVVGGTIIVTNYPINGMGDAGGFLYAGDPLSNFIRRISYDGVLLGSTVAAFLPTCCSEDMIFDGQLLYHAHFPSVIELINPNTGAVVQTFPQTDVVGMTFVGGGDDGDDDNGDDGAAVGALPSADDDDDDGGGSGQQIWITKWGARQVGTWDPATNTFTPRFTTPTNAGGLAWDSGSRVLWVGLQGGQVVPYRLDGTPLNAGFQPFGPIPNTIDGLEFVEDIDGDDDDDNGDG